jgi:hypothetical protein
MRQKASSEAKFLFILLAALAVFGFMVADYALWSQTSGLGTNVDCHTVKQYIQGAGYVETQDCSSGVPAWLLTLFVLPSGVIVVLLIWHFGKPIG